MSERLAFGSNDMARAYTKEYCTGKEADFRVVFTATFYRLWQCKQCAYEFSQPIEEEKLPVFPIPHPMPVATQIIVTDEQKTRLKAILRMHEEAEKHGNAPDFNEFLDFFAPSKEAKE